MARQGLAAPGDALLSREADGGFGTGVAGVGEGETGLAPARSPVRKAWRRFRPNIPALLGLIVLCLVVLAAIFAPFLHTANPLAQNYAALDAPPSAQHWLGTDGVGRDQYSRLLYGLRVPLVVGTIGTVITLLVGTLIGVVAGYTSGLLDDILSRFTDLIFAFPSFALALIVVSLYGPALDPYFAGAGRVILLSIVFAAVSWPPLMRFVRSLALSLKEQQFIEAARVAGTTDWQIIRCHLLPSMVGLLMVQASFIFIGVIATETTLSIFGLGVTAPNPDLGQMLYDGVSRLDYSPWEVLAPSIALTTLILALTFVSDGLRDATDTRMTH